ncbi:MAG TPA: lysine 2,3-aminomutase, partial [Caldithrix sp.]|nr:lysine 2,3-aminomutase [Caldithrix sp.]
MFYSMSRFLDSKFAKNLSSKEIADLKLLTRIFPFKISRYVLEELIDWKNKENDPIYRLTFPQPGMLEDSNWDLLKSAKSHEEQKQIIKKIRIELNPHPDGQTDNIPRIGKRTFGGIQHKYKETVLFFPSQGQTCHSFCTYCFRWAQFVNLDEHKFRSKDQTDLSDYLSHKKDVTDILFTGGDPLFMSNDIMFNYLDVIMKPKLEHITNIRIGTKALAFYPQRFLGDEGDKLLTKLRSIRRAGKNIALMAHFSHPIELSTEKVHEAIRRLRNHGVIIRTQAPLIKGINDNADIWRNLWNDSVGLGIVPYYMFVERDTGAHHYFSVPLYRAYQIFTEAYSKITGLAKTVRGPSMSAKPGKVLIVGITGRGDDKKFVLKFIQARNPLLVNKPFFAKFSEEATWLDELEIESPMREMITDD